MWYFAWVLGLGLACAFAILNAMWYEIRAQDNAEQRDADPLDLPRQRPDAPT